VLYDTRHGTLLPGHGSLALALHLQLKDDRSLDALFDLTRASNIERAFDSTREIGAAALNFVFAEPEHIGWQVSGRYPNRRDGQGLLPSPGWDGRYDWDGYADAMLHPTTRTRPPASSATPTSAASPRATACSCRAAGTTLNAPSAWPSWRATAATTAAA
jgi:acyl-homoserine-lactone acylase